MHPRARRFARCITWASSGLLFLLVLSPPVFAHADDGDASGEPTVSISPQTGARIATNEFALELHLAAWFRADLVERSGDVTVPFTVPLLRPWLRITMLDGRIDVFAQPELAGTPRLLDFQFDVRIVDGLNLRVGQFRTPFSRAYINPIITLALTDRGVVSDTFRLDRDTGLMFFGAPLDGALEYSVAVFNGATINNLGNDAPAPLVLARLVGNIGGAIPYDQVPWTRHASLAVGGAFGYQRRFDESAEVVESWHVNGEAAFTAGPLIVLGEGFLRRSRAPSGSWTNDFGGYAQATVMLVSDAWDVSARFGRMLVADGHTTAVEIGTNLYWWRPTLRHHVKLQLRYLWTDGVQIEHSGRAQVQLSF